MPSNELAYGRIMGDGTNLSRFERFLVIVEYCVHHAARAIVSAQTRKVLVDRRPSDHHFEGEGMHEIQEEVLDSRNRWLLLRAIKGEQLKAATVPGRPGRASDAEANTRSAPSSEAE
jgi:hypothetical protein